MRVAASLLAALALGACGLPSRDRIQADLQAIAEAGAPPEAVTVEVVALERGDGDMGAFEQTVVYDLKVWRDGRLIGDGDLCEDRGPLGAHGPGAAGTALPCRRAAVTHDQGRKCFDSLSPWRR